MKIVLFYDRISYEAVIDMPKYKLSDSQIEKLSKLYKDSDIPMDKLCEMFEVSDDTILRAMKRMGLPRRVTVGFCGEKNSNWKGGYSLHYAKNLAKRHFQKNECLICGYKISTDVHHWDRNKNNNKQNNLILVCPNHHREIHLGLVTKENIIKN